MVVNRQGNSRIGPSGSSTGLRPIIPVSEKGRGFALSGPAKGTAGTF